MHGRVGPRIFARIPALAATPISACVFGLFVAGVASHLLHGNFRGAIPTADLLVRILIYYLVMVTAIDSHAHLRSFLGWVVAFALALSSLAVLHYQGVINVPSLEACQQKDIDPATGEVYVIPRLCSTGIFNDPNDLSMMLVLGILFALYLMDSRQGIGRFLWLAPIGFFVYALKLTYSRGGLLNLVLSLFILSLLRLGRKKTVIACVFALPVMIALFAGRQTRIDLTDSSDTSQGRIQLWVAALALWRGAPLFGIGMGELREQIGFVAHNSFVQTYAEQGYFGGTIFAGAFYTGIYSVLRLLRHDAGSLDPAVRQMGPYLLAVLSSYCLGMFALSRAETVPTYMVLGIATAYLELASAQSSIGPSRLDWPFIKRLCIFGVFVLGFLLLFCRSVVRFG